MKQYLSKKCLLRDQAHMDYVCNFQGTLSYKIRVYSVMDQEAAYWFTFLQYFFFLSQIPFRKKCWAYNMNPNSWFTKGLIFFLFLFPLFLLLSSSLYLRFIDFFCTSVTILHGLHALLGSHLTTNLMKDMMLSPIYWMQKLRQWEIK